MTGKMSYDNAWTIQGYKVVWQAYACINDVSPTRPARITRYRSTQKAVPVRWMLCLPDCVLPSAVFRTRQHSDTGNIWGPMTHVSPVPALSCPSTCLTVSREATIMCQNQWVSGSSGSLNIFLFDCLTTHRTMSCWFSRCFFRQQECQQCNKPQIHEVAIAELGIAYSSYFLARLLQPFSIVRPEATIMCQNRWVSCSSGSLTIFLFDCLTTHRTMSCWFSGCFFRQQECQQCNKPQNTWSAIAELGIA